MNKHSALKALAKKRKQSRRPGYKCIGDYYDGAYECDFVSPYTKTAGNVNSRIMVVLQDWSSDVAMRRGFNQDCVTYGYYRPLRTNRTLVHLLETYFGVGLSDIYATNLFPFVKMGKISAPIPSDHLVRAAKEFAIPQIEIVRPKLVICLGLSTFKALREVCNQIPVKTLFSAIQSPFSFGKTEIWCQAHTGAWGQRHGNRCGNRVSNDWRRMKNTAMS